MIVCFGALAGIYVIARRAARRRRPGHRLHRRDQRPDPVRDHAHPDEGRARAGSSSRRRPSRRRSPSIVIAVVIALAIARDRLGRGGRARPARPTDAMSQRPVQRVRAAVRDRQRAAARGGHRRRLPRQARAGRAVVSDSLDAYLVLSGLLFAIGTFGFLARRNAISMLMSIELMLNARQPRRSSRSARSSRTLGAQALGHRADGHGRRGGRGDRRPGDRHRHLPQQEDAAGRRVRRDAPVRPMTSRRSIPLLRRPADGRASCSRRSSGGGSASRRTGSRSCAIFVVVGHRDGRSSSSVLTERAAAAVRRRTATTSTLFTWIPAGDFVGRRRLLRRRADRLPADRGDDDRPARPRLLDRLHEPRPGLLAVLRLPQPVHVPMLLLVLADNFLRRVRRPGSWSACRATC